MQLNHRKILQETYTILIILAILIIATILTFYREPIIISIKAVLAIFYLYFVPGYLLLLHQEAKIRLGSRLILSPFIGFATTGVVLYLLGKAGLKFFLFPYVLPALFCAIGIVLYLFKKRTDSTLA